MVQQARAKATRQALVRGAAEVFLTKGYARTTMADVAAEAGVTKGALYFHFESKEVLARAVIAEQGMISKANAEAVLAAGYRAVESLVRVGGAFAGELMTEPVVQAGTRLSIETFSLGLQASDPYAGWVAVAEEQIRAGMAEGDLRQDLDAFMLATFLISAFTGVHVVSQMTSRRADFVQRLEEMWRTVLPGMVACDKLQELSYLPGVVGEASAGYRRAHGA